MICRHWQSAIWWNIVWSTSLSSLANAGIRSVFGIFQQENISSVFDHIRSGRSGACQLFEPLLSVLQPPVEKVQTLAKNTTITLDLFETLWFRQTVALNCDILVSCDLNQSASTCTIPLIDQSQWSTRKCINRISRSKCHLNIDETESCDWVKELFWRPDPEALYNMSTDIFSNGHSLVDWKIGAKKFVRNIRKTALYLTWFSGWI